MTEEPDLCDPATLALLDIHKSKPFLTELLCLVAFCSEGKAKKKNRRKRKIIAGSNKT